MIVTPVVALTAAVVIAKVVFVAPPLTVTLAGAVATAALLLPSDTTMPLDGAALVSVTVPCDGLPPITLVGLRATVDSAGLGGAVPAFTNKDVAALSRRSPVIVTAVSAVTVDVASGNVARAAPGGPETVDGIVAAALELKSCTGAPPVGAALCSVTVPVDVAPPATLAGDTETSTRGGIELAGGLTVIPRLAPLAPYAADSDTVVVVDTDRLVTNANDAVVDPVKTVTVGGSELKSSG